MMKVVGVQFHFRGHLNFKLIFEGAQFQSQLLINKVCKKSWIRFYCPTCIPAANYLTFAHAVPATNTAPFLRVPRSMRAVQRRPRTGSIRDSTTTPSTRPVGSAFNCISSAWPNCFDQSIQASFLMRKRDQMIRRPTSLQSINQSINSSIYRSIILIIIVQSNLLVRPRCRRSALLRQTPPVQCPVPIGSFWWPGYPLQAYHTCWWLQ